MFSPTEDPQPLGIPVQFLTAIVLGLLGLAALVYNRPDIPVELRLFVVITGPSLLILWIVIRFVDRMKRSWGWRVDILGRIETSASKNEFNPDGYYLGWNGGERLRELMVDCRVLEMSMKTLVNSIVMKSAEKHLKDAKDKPGLGADTILVNLHNLIDPISKQGIRTYDRQWLEHLQPEFFNFFVNNTSSGSDSLPEFFSDISGRIRNDEVINQFWVKKRKLFSHLKTLRSSRARFLVLIGR